MKRRGFIKDVAVGSVALTSLPTLMKALPASADEGGKTGYQFLDISDGAGRVSGKSIFMNGVGKFGSGVMGGGQYVISDTATFSVIFDFGFWEAVELVSFANVGAVAAGFLGGTLTMDVLLKSAIGGEVEATLTVNCDGGAVLSPATGGGGNGSGDVVTLIIKNGTFAGTFGPGSVLPFNVTIFIAPSEEVS